jgi:putative SOS response-associated peptidase YedK
VGNGLKRGSGEPASFRANVKEVVTSFADLTSRYNISPGQMNPVITSRSPNEISRMFWGLIPFWAKDDKKRFSTINARAETAGKSPAYREPFRHKRCIIPATGFYEPDTINFAKSPFPWHFFRFKDQRMFGFAWLYDIWTDKTTGQEIRSYTIITTKPNELVRVAGKVM